MQGSFEFARLSALLAMIARSPIVAAPVAKGPVPDWATLRHSPDVDGFILEWLAGQARGTPRRLDS